MKKFRFIVIFLISQLSFAQVGIGTINPDPNTMLDVQGKVKIEDGTEGENKTLVSDSNGVASWENVNDGVKTEVLRISSSTEPVVWLHPAGVEVRFDPDTETVTVENKTGDSTHYWDVVIYGGAIDRNTVQSTNYKANFIKDDGNLDSFSFDLGDNDMVWFKIIASDQNNNSDGFILQIVYYSDDLNGMVQYW